MAPAPKREERTKMSIIAKVEGTEVKIGDSVGFKADVEQSGTITKIKRNMYGSGALLVLSADCDEGFHGGYIGGDLTYEIPASDCWLG